jgi:hypothetical protein
MPLAPAPPVSLFSPSEAFRAAFNKRWQWSTHETAMWRLQSVRGHGLVPKNPGAVSDEVSKLVDERARDIVCLRPYGVTAGTGSSFPGVRAVLAVRSSDLPRRLVLDWSHSGSMELAREWGGRKQRAEELCCDIAAELGSAATIAIILPRLLRIRSKYCTDNPADWPLLRELKTGDAYRLGPDLGYDDCGNWIDDWP